MGNGAKVTPDGEEQKETSNDAIYRPRAGDEIRNWASRHSGKLMSLGAAASLTAAMVLLAEANPSSSSGSGSSHGTGPSRSSGLLGHQHSAALPHAGSGLQLTSSPGKLPSGGHMGHSASVSHGAGPNWTLIGVGIFLLCLAVVAPITIALTSRKTAADVIRAHVELPRRGGEDAPSGHM